MAVHQRHTFAFTLDIYTFYGDLTNAPVNFTFRLYSIIEPNSNDSITDGGIGRQYETQILDAYIHKTVLLSVCLLSGLLYSISRFFLNMCALWCACAGILLFTKVYTHNTNTMLKP